MARSKTQIFLYETIFGTETPLGRGFDVALLCAITLSVIAICLDSIPSIAARYHDTLKILEWGFTILFTLEYIARLYCSPRPLAYARSFYGMVDLLAILPSYLELLLPGASYLLIIRILRVLRVFRILKMIRYIREGNVLLRAILLSRRKVLVFFSSMSLLIIVFGSLMFLIEGPENGFTSIPKSIYWAIVTITTVGYGDISPQTPLGQAVASLTMLLGYSILAVPTGILTAELTGEIQREKLAINCPNCEQPGHDADARHCKFCGGRLLVEK